MSGALIPTISQVESWQPDTLAKAGGDVEAAGKACSDRVAEVDLAVDNTALHWQGTAASSASVRAVAECLAASKSYRAATSVASALTKAGSIIGGYRDALIRVRNDAVAAGMTVADDGSVTAPTFPGSDVDPLAAILQGSLNRSAADYQKRLKEQLVNCGSAVGLAKAFISAGLADLAAHGGPGGGKDGGVVLTGALGADLGRQVRDAAGSGKPFPPDLRAKVGDAMLAAGVPPDQLAAYLQGEPVTIPASTQDFAQQFFNNAGTDGFIAASEQLRSQGPSGQVAAAAMGNAMLMLSNEKVGTGVDATGKPTSPGSYDRLPADFKQLISTRVSTQGPDANASEYPDMGNGPQVGNMGAFLSKQNKFLDALGLSDPGVQPGTKMSTELYRQGEHLAWLESHNTQMGADSGLPLDDSINKSVELASRNHAGTAAILTGEGGPDVLGSGYHADTAARSLLQRTWSEGPNGPAIGSMLDWISKDANVTVPPGDPAYQHQLDEAVLAGRSAHGLADIMSTTKAYDGTNNFDVLSGSQNPNDYRLPYGKVNPVVAQHIAGALAPYVGNMVDMDGNLVNTHGFGSLKPVEATRVFSMLDGDPKAAAIINGAAIAQAHRIDAAFALGEGGTQYGLYSGRLRSLIESGLAVDAGLHGYDNATADAHRKDTLTSAFMTAKEWVNTGVKKLPWGDLWSPVAGSIEALIKDPTVAAFNEKSDVPFPAISFDPGNGGSPLSLMEPLTDERADAGRRYAMLGALVDAGRVDANSLSGGLARNGELLPFDQVKSVDVADLSDSFTRAGVDKSRLNEYLDHAKDGDKKIGQIVFGGRPPSNDIIKDVFRSNQFPAAVDTWG